MDIQTLIADIGALSYLGILGVAFLANVVVPVPEEIVLIAFGYIARDGAIGAPMVILLVLVGLFASDTVMYLLSRAGNRYVSFFYNKIFARRLGSHDAWISTHLPHVIFFSRFLIQLRFLGPFIAGQKKASYRFFATYDLLALLVYVPLFVWLGWYFQRRLEFIVDGVHTARNIVLTILILGIVFSLFNYLRRRALDYFKRT